MKFPAFEAIDLKNNFEIPGILELSLLQIVSDKNQPRKNFDEKALSELALSIKRHGVIQPIIVKKIDDNKYQIIAGERRWRASCLAGLKKILAIVQKNDEQENIAISLIENIQREELNPIELAEALYRLSHDYRLSHEAIASMVGKSRTTVTNLLRLLNLPENIRTLLITGKLEMGHARALLTLSAEQQSILANKIIAKNLSVRDTEKLSQLHKFPEQKKQNLYFKSVESWVERLSKRLSSKVSIKINEKGEGRVTIQFSSPTEVDWFIDQLNSD